MSIALSHRRAVGILISGRGSNMQALVAAAVSEDFPARIAVVISNRADAAGLDFARSRGIPTEVVPHKGRSREDFDADLDSALRRHEVELVCLAGFMRLLTDGFVQKWHGRMLNIHPSLLPSFKGIHVHERVVESGVRFTGCTVHFVSAEMDEGPIVAQAVVPVPQDATADDVATRVLAQEHVIYPRALRWLAEGRLRITAGRVLLDGAASPESALTNPG